MGPDYPLARWIPAFKGNYRPGREVPAPTQIVIHCTDGHPKAEDVGAMWARPMDKPSSANFCVGQDALVVQSVALADTAWHAHAANATSVGIEHCARTPGSWGPTDAGMPPTPEQYQASAKLAAWLCKTLGFAPSRVTILGHSEADKVTTHTKCPLGCGWDWERYMYLVQTAYEQAAGVV